MSFIDLIILFFYFGLFFLISYFIKDKIEKERDYFLGSKEISWKISALSIVAAETSALTFISIPGVAYATNMNFLQITFGYLIGRIIVAKYLLPKYFVGELSTAYSFLEKRFGVKTRRFASIIFIFTRVAADGVRLFATAIPFKLLLNIDYFYAIAIIAFVALFYSSIGGIKSVVYIDAMQFFVYILGALISLIYLFSLLPTESFSSEFFLRKINHVNFGLKGSFYDCVQDPYTLLSGIIGGAFLSMASHGTDQLIVQRLLATKELRKAQKAIITSGIFIIFQFALFLFIGVLLYLFYGSLNMKSDEIFTYFIINEVPSGFKGLIIAGLFAAAISTIAGSIISLSSSTVMDLGKLFLGKDNVKLLNSKYFYKGVTFFWTIVLIWISLFFLSASKSAVEIGLSVASFTYGGLLGAFLLGIISKKAKQEDALAAFAASIFGMIAVVSLKLVAWTWFTLVGVSISMIVGITATKIED